MGMINNVVSACLVIGLAIVSVHAGYLDNDVKSQKNKIDFLHDSLDEKIKNISFIGNRIELPDGHAVVMPDVCHLTNNVGTLMVCGSVNDGFTFTPDFGALKPGGATILDGRGQCVEAATGNPMPCSGGKP